MDNSKDISRANRTVPISELAQSLPVLRKTLNAAPDAVVAVTDHGKPTLALLSWDAWQELEEMAAAMESLEIMDNPATMAKLRQAEADIAAGNLIPGEVAMQQFIAEGLIDAPER